MSLKLSCSSQKLSSIPLGSKFVRQKWGAPCVNVLTSVEYLEIEGFYWAKSENGSFTLLPEYALVYVVNTSIQ